MELPVGTKCMKRRLQKLHNYIEKMKRSPVPAVNFAVLKFANLLPTWIIKETMIANYFPTVILSNFPGPPANSNGGGFPLVDTMFTGGPLRGNIGNHLANNIIMKIMMRTPKQMNLIFRYQYNNPQL
jgi:uncharacterized protein DUF1298